MSKHLLTPADQKILTDIMDGTVPVRDFFDKLPYGLIITDAAGRIIYYNDTQAKIDSLQRDEVLGRHVKQVYGPHPEPSLIASCLKSGQPIIDFICVYRTLKGKVVNSSHTIMPVFKDEALVGSICLIMQPKWLTAAAKISTRKEMPSVESAVTFDTLIGASLKFKKAVSIGRAAALSPSPVLLAGETGVGKEMFALGIHSHSERRARPFTTINCAAIPQELLEGLLFGTVKGAFTGAEDKAGLFEQAHGGTLFLDELDSMPLKLQPKLLRVLQEKCVRRVGSDREFRFDVKIISAIGSETDEALAEERLRPDLFYRLGVMVIKIPPLRERLDDLPILVDYFIMKQNYILGKQIRSINPQVLSNLLAYGWPGNVRELEHVIEAAMNMAGDEDSIGLDMLPEHFLDAVKKKPPVPIIPRPIFNGGFDSEAHTPLTQAAAPPPVVPPGLASLDDTERLSISEALRATQGNTTMAARMLGVSRQKLGYKMKKHGLDRALFKPDFSNTK